MILIEHNLFIIRPQLLLTLWYSKLLHALSQRRQLLLVDHTQDVWGLLWLIDNHGRMLRWVLLVIHLNRLNQLVVTTLPSVGMGQSRMVACIWRRQVAVRLPAVKVSPLVDVLHVCVIPECSNLYRVSGGRPGHIKRPWHAFMTIALHASSALMGAWIVRAGTILDEMQRLLLLSVHHFRINFNINNYY